MSDKKVFEVGYIEYPNTTLIYRSIEIDTDSYPELQGKTDEEAIAYIKENLYEMTPTEEFYDSLGDELQDQDVIREKISHIDSEIWVEVAKPSDDSSEEDDEDED